MPPPPIYATACMLKLIYPYFELAQEVNINFIIYYTVKRVCLYIKHVHHFFEVYIRSCCNPRSSKDIFLCFANP